MPTVHRPAGLLAGLALLAFVLGCSQKTASTVPQSNPEMAPPGPTGPTDTAGAQPTDGKGLFDRNCAKCHGTGGGGPKGKMGGPDLAKVGAEHDAAWIADHVRDPKSHKPDSRMPPFKDKFTEEQTKTVADYLAGLK